MNRLREQNKEVIKQRDDLINRLNPNMDYINPRKERTDKGVKRLKYSKSLPPLYVSIINRANKKGFEITITVEQLKSIVNNPCVYCGSLNSIGVDRIDSNEGYTPENSQPCCGKCNRMKLSYSNEEFIRHINKIYKHINSL